MALPPVTCSALAPSLASPFGQCSILPVPLAAFTKMVFWQNVLPSDGLCPCATLTPEGVPPTVPTVEIQQKPIFEKKEEVKPVVEKVEASDDETDDVLDYFRTLAES